MKTTANLQTTNSRELGHRTARSLFLKSALFGSETPEGDRQSESTCNKINLFYSTPPKKMVGFPFGSPPPPPKKSCKFYIVRTSPRSADVEQESGALRLSDLQTYFGVRGVDRWVDSIPIFWVWLKINQEGQTAGFGPYFHRATHFGIPVF